MLRKTLMAAMLIAFYGSAGAAGLGRMNVTSSLGQPLRAEVDITATPEELDSMVARLASLDAFKRANIDYLGAYSDVQVSVDKRSGKPVLRVSTHKPFNEPYVDLLIEVNWAGGRLLREFTFLLDPAEQPSRPAAPAPAAPAGRLESTAIPPQTPAPAAKPATGSAPAPSPAPLPSSASDSYTVARGDTLNKIAAEFRGEVSQEQMLAAFYRANSDAFAGGNINRLRAGKILKVPSQESASAVPRKEARQILLKASNFESYRQAVAGTAAAAPARESAAQGSAGKIAPQVEEKSAAATGARDKVKVTPAELAKPGKGGEDAARSQARIQSLQDEVASRDKALKEANSRVAELEKNVKELQKLVEMKNQGLAEAQKQAAAGAAKSSAAPAPVPAPVEPVQSAAPAAEPVAAGSQGVAEPVATEQSATARAEAAVESAPVAASKPAPAPAPAAVVEEEDEGFFGSHLWALLGAVGVIGVLGYVFAKQRRKRAEAGTGNTQMTESSTMSQNSVFGSAGGQTVDTGGTSLLHTDFSQSGMSAIDADEGVDPVAEADVYMAYGRDAQAEEILLDALKNDPGRTAVYLKLLEVYAQRQELKSFENVATDLYSKTGGAGDDWAKAAALGARLDPENPLYKSGGNVVEAAPVAPAAASEQEPPAAPVVSFGTSTVAEHKSTWTVPGDVQQFSAAKDEAPMFAEPPAAVETLSEPLNLDFNLDLESHAVDAPTEIESRKEEPAFDETTTSPSFGETVAPLEFDIGFDEEPEQAEPGVTAAVPVAPVLPAASDEPDLGIESSLAESDMAEVDLEKTNFDSSLLDFDFDLGDEIGKKEALDLSTIKIQQEAPKSAPSPAASVVHQPIQDNIDVDEEVATKLELAKAYEEMGDVEGARELLEEVISDGADAQKEFARTMLSRLA